ncbi:hypothetical protein P3T76_014544 [Phytophthora citrophthora]|uniref:Uncharacterized protein n=1 Tax=Phytophthora citrophthora TaxID=4793 RepID=A0AAD9G181_9STRA|nr:hypothetical protein P3T76_014544 [Phytophthora citrophthora]
MTVAEVLRGKARDCWWRLRKVSSAFQPELRGFYSSERIHDLALYSQTTPWWWALFVCVVSPFPCLVILILIDCAPLASPKEGSRANCLFWMRDFLTIALMTRVILEQFRVAVPGLNMTSRQILVLSMISSAAAVVFMIGMSSVVGFPLPFSLVIGINAWFVVLVACFWFSYGRILKQDLLLFKDLMRSIVVLVCQVLLTFVYPTYLYGFTRIQPRYQKFYVMLLTIIKIVARNLICYCLGDKYDLMPQIMIFNVDVFNALYVSSSMENSQSIATMLQMIMLDAVLGLISISDIVHFMTTISFLRRKIPPGHTLESASFIQLALLIVGEDPKARERIVLRRPSVKRTTRGPSMLNFRSLESKSKNRQILPVDPPQLLIPTAEPLIKPTSLELKAPGKSLKDIFSHKERQWLLERSARVLFTTEFVILVEYTEVVVPFIYSIYTAAMFFLPNSAYYPQLKSIDHKMLTNNLGMIVVYGFVELLSLVVIGCVIQRMLRISVLHLLSFVLDRSWRMVQSNLFLWICYTIQNSLEHNGADFSFSFAWLSNSTAA